MGTSISTRIMAFNGQCVNQIYHDEEQQCTIIKCCRDKRRNAIDPITGRKGTINQYIKRHVRDLPLFGKPCFVEIELYAYQHNALNFTGLATAHASKDLWNKLFTSCLLLKR